jgi:hypothetical protein
VIRFTRNHFLEHGMDPTVRLLGKASGVSIRELYRLFPRSPSYVAARIAGGQRSGARASELHPYFDAGLDFARMRVRTRSRRRSELRNRP